MGLDGRHRNRLGAAYMLWMYQRVFFGKISNQENENLQDLSGREMFYLVPIVLLCFWIGIYPKPSSTCWRSRSST